MTKKYLDIPGQLAHNKGMANASSTKSVTTPTTEMPATIAPFVDPEEWEEMDDDHRDEIDGYVGLMESAADYGDPIAEAWIADHAAVRRYVHGVIDT